MKFRALALVLALCMVLAMVPVRASAAALLEVPAPELAPAALPVPVQPQAKTYSIEMTCSGPGKAELYAETAGARESVYFLADPEPGYKVSFAKCGYYKEQYDMRLIYIGSNVYEIVMPDGDVKLDLEFVKIETKSHDVIVTATGSGMASVDQTSAKKGESLFVEAIPSPGYSLGSVRAKSSQGWLEGYYLGKVDGASLYEIFMPDEDVEILVDFKRNGPYTVTPYIDAPGGSLSLSHKTAYELETVTVTAKPDRGYQVASIGCYHSQLTKKSENVWTFPMPKFNEEVHVRFEAIVYPLSVTVETGLGGTAVLDAEGATIGQTVKLTCAPEEGYRVARVAGVKNLVDNGDNSYSFVMDAAPVELKVLFLRENNPFLDVNETQFFHESVLWAVEEGITSGLTADTFGPFAYCNRAQVVTFLWRAAGSPEPTATEHPFTDVDAGSFYEKAVLWAIENGITNGISATAFGPTRDCNRAQVVTFLFRARNAQLPEGAVNPFVDVKEDDFFYAPVLWALENGVTTGADATHFNPNGPCQRAQVVTFLYRADRIPEPKPDPLPFPDLG